MRSACIITMHCPLNYGAILQTYALQTYLESLGLNVRVIDYRPKYVVCDQHLMYVGSEKYKNNFISRWAYRFLKAPSKIARIRKFGRFAKNELHLTPVYETYEEISEAHLNADFFFCGSDQIWNIVSGSHKDPSYFLDFVPAGKKRISYAASGNLPVSDEVRNITFPMINKIDCISMREDSTIATIQPFINKPIVHVCDPVFLLKDDDWRELYKKHSSFKPTEKYVLVYPMGNGEENTMDHAFKCAKQMNLPLYRISASIRKDGRVDKQFNVTPYDFLVLIDNAECIVTNSFHGTSFSVILQKQFWTCVAEGSNQRIASILSKAGLLKRMIDKNRIIDYSEKCNFDQAAQKLKEHISRSKTFIQSSINE